MVETVGQVGSLSAPLPGPALSAESPSVSSQLGNHVGESIGYPIGCRKPRAISKPRFADCRHRQMSWDTNQRSICNKRADVSAYEIRNLHPRPGKLAGMMGDRLRTAQGCGDDGLAVRFDVWQERI